MPILVTLLALIAGSAHAARRIMPTPLSPLELADALALHQRNPKLYRFNFVRDQARSQTRDEKLLSQPESRLALCVRALEGVESAFAERAEHLARLRRAKRLFYRLALTRRLPEAYFDLQARIDRERGRGDTLLSSEERADHSGRVLADQRRSLEIWVDYMTGPDSFYMRGGVKYWILASVMNLGLYNKDKQSFERRSNSQAALFPELNRDALARVVQKVGPSFAKANFAKLYGEELAKTFQHAEHWTRTQGHWRKFERGSDVGPLVASLDEMCTGWCTVGRDVARAQLEKGDLHVFYSADPHGKERIPRLAIRLEGDRIVEVRGVGPQQEIDGVIASTEILNEKLKEFGAEGERFVTASRDMKRVTTIARQIHEGRNLSKDDLRFIYEIDRAILGFGYVKDPRIEEIRASRVLRADLEKIFEGVYSSAQISTNAREALAGGIQFHWGNLTVAMPLANDLPRWVAGNLRLTGEAGLDRIVFPDRIDGTLEIPEVSQVKRLIVRGMVRGDILLPNLRRVTHLELPSEVPGSVDLSTLEVLDGVTFPQRVGLDLNLSGATTIGAIELPQHVGRSLVLKAHTLAPGILLPAFVGGNFIALNLRTARNLTLPAHVGKYLLLISLESAENVQMPLFVGESLDMERLTRLKDFNFPEHVGEHLTLSLLESCENVQFPLVVGGNVNVYNLRSAVRTALPRSIRGYMLAAELIFVDSVTWPDSVRKQSIVNPAIDFARERVSRKFLASTRRSRSASQKHVQ